MTFLDIIVGVQLLSQGAFLLIFANVTANKDASRGL